MFDWEGRIDDVMDYLKREYAVDDRETVSILLAALVDCPRTPSCWLVLETNWFWRHCLTAWFSFGETWVPEALPRLREHYPWRELENEVRGFVDNPSDEHLFVEPDFHRYPCFTKINLHYLLQRTLRVRLVTPRVIAPLRTLDRREEDRRIDHLRALTRAVIEDRIGARGENPPAFHEPPDFLYYVELVQRLAPWYTDWHQLLQAFGALGVRHAYLHGRRQVEAEDYRAMARVARDSVPPWIAKALGLLLDGPAKYNKLEAIMGLEEKRRRSGHGAQRELVRLRRGAVIEWDQHKLSWHLAETHPKGITALLDGRAFGVDTLPAMRARSG